MNTQNKVEVVMKDNSLASADDVIDTLIVSEVENTIAVIQQDSFYDLTKQNDITEIAKQLVEYFKVHTGITVALETFIKEIRQQLQVN